MSKVEVENKWANFFKTLEGKDILKSSSPTITSDTDFLKWVAAKKEIDCLKQVINEQIIDTDYIKIEELELLYEILINDDNYKLRIKSFNSKLSYPVSEILLNLYSQDNKAFDLPQLFGLLDFKATDKDNNTLLHFAAHAGYADLLPRSLFAFIDVDARNSAGLTPAHLAAAAGHHDVINILHNNGANLNGRDKNDYTPAHLAAAAGHHEVINILHRNGANLNAMDKNDYTPAHLAAAAGHYGVINILHRNGANLNAMGKNDCTPAHLAAAAGHHEVINILHRNGANLNAMDKNDYTPAHLAAAAGHHGVINILHRNGANLNAMDKNDYTPAHLAVAAGHYEVINILHRNGANLNTIKREANVSYIPVEEERRVRPVGMLDKGHNITPKLPSSQGPLQLHAAASKGDTKVVKELLTPVGVVDVNEQNKDGNTALHLAKKNSHYLIDILIAHRASLSIKNYTNGITSLEAILNKGYTLDRVEKHTFKFINQAPPERKLKILEGKIEELQHNLDLAWDSTGIVQEMMAHFQEEQKKLINNINYTLQERPNPKAKLKLHAVARKGNRKEITRLLADSKVDINVQDKVGNTALHLIKKLYSTVIDEFISHGASLSLSNSEGITSLQALLNKGYHADRVVKYSLNFVNSAPTMEEKLERVQRKIQELQPELHGPDPQIQKKVQYIFKKFQEECEKQLTVGEIPDHLNIPPITENSKRQALYPADSIPGPSKKIRGDDTGKQSKKNLLERLVNDSRVRESLKRPMPGPNEVRISPPKKPRVTINR